MNSVSRGRMGGVALLLPPAQMWLRKVFNKPGIAPELLSDIFSPFLSWGEICVPLPWGETLHFPLNAANVQILIKLWQLSVLGSLSGKQGQVSLPWLLWE